MPPEDSADTASPRTIGSIDPEHVFTYRAPTPAQQHAYELIRADAKRLAYTIMGCTPVCADQSAAIRSLREAVMTANAAIALKGRLHG